jgi:hypothetical protein
VPQSPVWRRFVVLSGEALAAAVVIGVVVGLSVGGPGRVVAATAAMIVIALVSIGIAGRLVRRRLNAHAGRPTVDLPRD